MCPTMLYAIPLNLPDVLQRVDMKLTRSLKVLRVSVNEGGSVDVTNAESTKQMVRKW